MGRKNNKNNLNQIWKTIQNDSPSWSTVFGRYQFMTVLLRFPDLEYNFSIQVRKPITAI